MNEKQYEVTKREVEKFRMLITAHKLAIVNDRDSAIHAICIDALAAVHCELQELITIHEKKNGNQ